VLSLAVAMAALPRIAQSLFWYANHHPPDQAIYVPSYPPDIHDNLVRGIPTHSFVTSSRMDFLDKNLTHRPGDVWIDTYQKTGTTWTTYMVTLIQGHPVPSGLLEAMNRCPWPEVGVGILSISPDALEQSAASTTFPRCFKSHWPRADFMAEIPSTSRIIYVLRDAESVAVSFWEHIFNQYGLYYLKEGDMTWDQYFEKWFHGDFQNGGYLEHVASWWKVRDNKNVLILNYDDMRKDVPGTIRRIANFIDIHLDDARLAEIVYATSKKAMRKLSDGPQERLLQALGIVRDSIVRNDQVKEAVGFTDAQRSRMEEKYEKLLKPLGVPRKYMFRKDSAANGRVPVFLSEGSGTDPNKSMKCED
jgi:hypothetical protein